MAQKKITQKDLGLTLGSGILLFLPFPDFNLYLLEWIAFVPLLFAIEGKSHRQSYMLGVIAGTIGCLGGFYWFADWARIVIEVPAPVDWLGALGHSFFAGQVFGLSILLFVSLRGNERSFDLFLFPAAIVTIFSIYPLLFPFKLGDGQTLFLAAIQAVDLTGVFGLDFVIALVNILLFSYMQSATPKPPWFAGLVVLLVVGCWFGYGVLNLSRWDNRISRWDTVSVGFVQPNRPATLKTPVPEKGYSREYPLDLEMSEKLAEEGNAPIIVWPEGHFYGYRFWTNVEQSFNKRIARMGAPVIIYDATFEMVEGEKRYFNSSIFIDRDGVERGKYNKIKLVPFGEYTPLIGKIPIIRDLLGDYQGNLTAGIDHRFFDVNGVILNPKICYEPLFTELTAESVAECPNGCVLLVQSQDGWYGQTSQPAQHTAATVLRAVENRVPLIHVINNGPSSLIAPNGRIQFQSARHERGYWLAELSHSKLSGGSFYSHHPRLFLNSVRLVLLGFIIFTLIKKFNLFKK